MQYPAKYQELPLNLRGWVNHVHYANTIGLRKALFQRFDAQIPLQLRTAFNEALKLDGAASHESE